VSLPVPTSGLVVCPAESSSFGPDNVWNYEVGEKAKFLDDRLVVNSDIYFIRWGQIQQNITLACGYTYTTNAGIAHSYGPELELNARLLPGLTLTANGAWTHSTITSANPATGIPDGTPVLNIPKETGDLALVYDRHLWSDVNWTTRLSDSYVGTTHDIAFAPTILPPYMLVAARSGFKWDGYNISVFGDNLGNKHAELTTNNTAFTWNSPTITRVTTNQPRTIGVDLQYQF
jgi:iron complex outermembrane recepter protein